MFRTVFPAVVAAACLSPAAHAQNALADIQEALVFVQVKNDRGALLDRGSGVIINNTGFILTAKHLFSKFDEGAGEVLVSLRSREAYPLKARLYKCTDDKFDICVLKVSSASVASAQIRNPFKLKCSMPKIGTPVFAAGFPPGDFSPSTIVPGIISTDEPAEKFKYYMSAAASPGMSGGPVFGGDGSLFGLVHGKADGTAIFLVAHLAPAKGLIEESEADCPRLTVALERGGLKVEPASDASIAKETGKPLAGIAQIDATQVPALRKVYFQIANEKQRSEAKGAVEILLGQQIPVARGIENVGERAPNKAQVRYFDEASRSEAERVLKSVSEAGLANAELRKVDLPGGNPAKGVVEVWWPTG